MRNSNTNRTGTPRHPGTGRAKTRKLAVNGVLAAAYAALNLAATALNLAYGPVQFRFSEALTVLPWLFPGTWPGLTLGCLLANLLSPYGPLDVILGTLATGLAAWLTQKMPRRWLAPVPPVVCNGLLIGGMLTWYEIGFSAGFWPLFVFNALWVGLGEATVCFLLGGLLLRSLPKTTVLKGRM